MQVRYRGFRRARLSEIVSSINVDQDDEIDRVGMHARPVLIIWGKQDPSVPFEFSEALLEQMPRARLVAVESSGSPAADGAAGDRQRGADHVSPAGALTLGPVGLHCRDDMGGHPRRDSPPAPDAHRRKRVCVAAAWGAEAAGQAPAAKAAELRWAGDSEGGAPFVEADPSHPDDVAGFDVEIAGLMARGLGRTPRFVLITFTSIDQSIVRGDAEIGMSGIEDTPARRATLAPLSPTTNSARC